MSSGSTARHGLEPTPCLELGKGSGERPAGGRCRLARSSHAAPAAGGGTRHARPHSSGSDPASSQAGEERGGVGLGVAPAPAAEKHCVLLHRALLHRVASQSVGWHCTAKCCFALYCIAKCCVALRCVAKCCTVSHCIAKCCIALHRMALHRVALHCSTLRCSVLCCKALHPSDRRS